MIRSSSISVRRDVRAELSGMPAAPERRLGPLLERCRVVRRCAPIDQTAADEPERVLALRIDRVGG